MYENLYKYATDAIAEILPIDKNLCKEMVKYALSLPSDHELESHFLDILGPSDATFDLIRNFKQIKEEEDKKRQDEERLRKMREERAKPSAAAALAPSGSKGKNAWGAEQEKRGNSGARLNANKNSVTISELADAKPSGKATKATAKKRKKKNLDNLKDIEAALNDLEVESAASGLDNAISSRRVCNCMATRHPLFEVAPNCLNCGKIICSKEGLQPCSFCGKELLLSNEKKEIITILRSERDQSDNKKEFHHMERPSLATGKAKKGIKVSVSAGENLWKAQEAALAEADAERKRVSAMKEEEIKKKKELEELLEEIEHYEKTKDINPDLLEAQNRLNTLLNFQATGAERTRIIDNAADFEMPSESSASMWLSPVERALQLKKQQKLHRKAEEQRKQRIGRTKKVVEMVIKDGKVKMVEKHIETEDTGEDDREIQELQNDLHNERLEQESTMAKNVWDYESDGKRWNRPVYLGIEKSNGGQDVTDAPKHSKVQPVDKVDSDELIVALPS